MLRRILLKWDCYKYDDEAWDKSGPTLRKKCPNTDQKKLRIWTLFTHPDENVTWFPYYLTHNLHRFKNENIKAKAH